MNLKPVFKAICNFCKRHSTKLLAAGAITAQGIGYYFMHKEAPIVNERLKSLPEDATFMDKLKVVGPVYLPAFGMFLLSSGCIVGGVIAGEKKIAIVSGLYSASQAALSKMEEQMTEQIGPEKTREAKEEAVKAFLTDKSETESSNQVPYVTGDGIDLFEDPFTGRWFYSSQTAIDNGVAKFNRLLTGDLSGSVNELRRYWGLPDCELGDYVGWDVDSITNSTGRSGLDVGYEPFIADCLKKSGQRIKIYNDVVMYNGGTYCRARKL